MKRIIAILSLIALLMVTLTSCGQAKTKNPTKPDYIPEENTSEYNLDSNDYRTIAENDKLVLLYNDLTTDIRVKVKDTGYVWSTEIDDIDDGTVERGQIFSLDYYTNTGVVQSLDSSAGSVQKGQFKATEIDNGIKVQYGIGYVNFKIKFPMAISAKHAEEVLSRMSDEDKALFNANYMIIDFDSLAMKEAPDEQKQLNKQKFPLALKEPWYYPRGSFNDVQVVEMNELFARANYTEKELKRDNVGVTINETERPEFSVTVYYTLENGSLSVKIPETEIYHSKNFIIKNISLMKGFMDFDSRTDGYYLLPDGSGSVMNFDNGKDELRNEAVYIPIYGIDESKYIREKTAYYNDAILPVLGACVKSTPTPLPQPQYDEAGNVIPTTVTTAPTANTSQPKNGVLAIIEEGETFAGVEAHPGDGSFTHNAAWIEFRINEENRMKTFTANTNSNEQHSMFQFQRYLGNLKVRFNFLTGEDSEYSGMAKNYRNYLFGDTDKSVTKPYYSTVEMIGLVNGYGNVLGISYNTKKPLTTFKQVESIAKDLQSKGLSNMNIKLSGWFNGGYEHGYAKKVKVSKELGGSDGLKTLISDLNSANIGLYPDVDIQYVYREAQSVPKKDISYMLNRRKGIIYSFNAASFSQMTDFSKYILSMDAVVDNFNSFFESYKQFDIKNVSLRSIGDNINANYSDKATFMDRQESLQNLLKLVSGAKENGYSIMGTSGNAPFAKYLSVINNMPIESAGFDKCDYSVPFTAMVFSGNLDYTYKPINLSNSDRSDLLKLIESGSGAYFTLTGQEYDKITETQNKVFYSTVYDDIKENVIKSYNYVSGALKNTYGQQIVKHERLADGVYKTTYKNGYYTIVNYNAKDYNANGITVKSNDYVSKKGV